MRGVGARFAAMAALVAGCGSPETESPDGVEIRFWAMGREGEVVQELVRDFEGEHPGIRVRVQQIPWSAAHEKLLTAYVGYSTPDLAQLGNTWVAEFAALDALAAVEPWLRSSDLSENAFFPGIWDTNVIDGTAYGVPWYVDTRVLFYRNDILTEVGYPSMPATWSEWRAAMEAVKREVGPDRFAIFLPTNEWTQPVILGLQCGSSLLNSDATGGAFSAPAFRDAFAFYLGLFEAGLAPAIGSNEIANLYQEFARGYFAMYVTGPWNIGEFRRRMPPELEGKWSTAPLPGPDDGSPGVSLAGGSSLVMFEKSKHKQAAWKLIEFLSRPEQQVRFYRLIGDLPAVQSAWSDSALSGDSHLGAFREQLLRVSPTPKVPEWEQIAVKVQEQAERAIRGRVDPDSALAQLDRDAYRILEKRRWLLRHRTAEESTPGEVSP